MRSTNLTPRSIGQAVPQAGLDLFSWQCIQGEPYPPTFGADVIPAGPVTPTGHYDGRGPWPCITLTSGASGASGIESQNAQWPMLPTYSPREMTFSGFTMSFRLYIDHLDPGNVCGVGLGAGVTIGVDVTSDQTIAAYGLADNFPGTPFPFGQWIPVSLTVGVGDTASLSVNGEMLGSTILASPLGNAPIRPTLNLGYTGGAGGTAEASLTTLAVTYP